MATAVPKKATVISARPSIVLAPNPNPSKASCATQVEVVGNVSYDGIGGIVKIDTPGTGQSMAPVAGQEQDLVAFAAVEILCYEGDSSIWLTIARRGHGVRALTVGWQTTNVSLPEASWAPQSGEVTIAAGAMSAECEVRIAPNPNWSTELSQTVELTTLSGGSNPVLGELSKTTLVQLNAGRFPNNVVDHDDQYHTIKGFVVHNWREMPREARLGFLCKVYPAVGFMIEQYMLMDLIDAWACALAFEADDAGAANLCGAEERSRTLFWAAVFLVNFALYHWCDYQFRSLRLDGKVKLKLRTAIMTTVLQLTNAEQERFTAGKVTKIMGDQVDNSVDTTWANVFVLLASLLQLAGQVMFTLVLVANMGDAPIDFRVVVGLIPAAVIGVNVALLVRFIKPQSALNMAELLSANEWSSFFAEMMLLRPLITIYRRGQAVADEFNALHKRANGAGFRANMSEAATAYASRWFPTLLAFGFVVYGGEAVMDGSVDLGVWIGAFNTLREFSTTASSIYSSIVAIIEGHASIQKIAELLNADTRRKRLHAGTERRTRLLAELERGVPGGLKEDSLLIYNAEYAYGGAPRSALPRLSLEIVPGQLIAISDSEGGQEGGGETEPMGKATLLRLLARQLLPSEGFIAYPTRWRVRICEGTPLLQDTTLLANLKWGNQKAHPDDEIWALARKMGLSKPLLGAGEFQVGPLGDKLSLSDRITVFVTRALLSSVDLLMVGTSVIDSVSLPHAAQMMATFREFVEHRGCPCLATEHAKTPEYLKKKKTVFVATKQPEIEEMSDAAVLLTPPPLPPPLPAPPTPSNWDAELDVTFCGLGTGGVQVAEEV